MSRGDRLVGEYLQELELVLGRRPATVRLRRYQLADWQRWLTPLDLRDAHREQVVAYLSRWQCPDTRASRRDALAGFYRWAVVTGSLRMSPVEMVVVHGRDRPDPHPAPDAAVNAALRCGDRMTRRAVILGRFAGLRAGEIAAVHTDDVRWRPQHLRVVGKGGKVRYVPVHDRVAELLGEVGDGYVFPSRCGHWTPHPISRRVSAALPPPWTCHSLRHAFATALYEMCGDWVLVQEALGHASVETTKRYVLVRPERAVAAVRRLTLDPAA